MLYGQIEREMLDGEPWFWQQTRLPHNLERLVEQDQERRDVWECSSKHLSYPHIRLNKIAPNIRGRLIEKPKNSDKLDGGIRG